MAEANDASENGSEIEVWEVKREEGWVPYPKHINQALKDRWTYTFTDDDGVTHQIDTASCTETTGDIVLEVRTREEEEEKELDEDEEAGEEEVEGEDEKADENWATKRDPSSKSGAAPLSAPAPTPASKRRAFDGIGMWQFQDEHGEWKDYPDPVNVALQNAPTHTYTHGRWQYTVDRVNLVQTNDNTATQRTIQQVTFPPGSYKFLVHSWIRSGLDTGSNIVRKINRDEIINVTKVTETNDRLRGHVNGGFITMFNFIQQKALVTPQAAIPRGKVVEYQWKDEHENWNDYPSQVNNGLHGKHSHTYTFSKRQYKVTIRSGSMSQTNLQTGVVRPVRAKPSGSTPLSSATLPPPVSFAAPPVSSPVYSSPWSSSPAAPTVAEVAGPKSQWQYLDEFNNWNTYPDEVNVALRNCPSGNFTYTFKQRVYNVDLKNMHQNNMSTGVQRQVRMMPGTGGSPNAPDPNRKTFQFLHASGNWVDYPDEVNAELTKCGSFVSEVQVWSFVSNGDKVSVDLTTMKQTTTKNGIVVKVRQKPANSSAPLPKIPIPGALTNTWETIAGDCATEEGLRRLFEARQAASVDWRLKLISATKLENRGLLESFVPGSNCRLLFHGTEESQVANISMEGLRMTYGSSGNLDVGLYGAEDPRKAYSYTSGKHGRFIFLAAYNVDEAKSGAFSINGGFASHNRFVEYAVNSDHHVVVLWMIKVERTKSS